MSIRIVVSLDIDAEDPVSAYRRLYNEDWNSWPSFIVGWDTTDEWYDNEGNPLPVEEVGRARGRVFAEEEKAELALLNRRK